MVAEVGTQGNFRTDVESAAKALEEKKRGLRLHNGVPSA